MRAFIHGFQGKPWNEECKAAFDGFGKLGIECVLFTENETLDQRKPEDIVVGGMLIMSHALNEYGVMPPNYDYPDELIKFTGRKIWSVKLKNLKREMLPVFIKPAEEKAAKGAVIYDWNDIGEYEKLDPEADILCSEAMDFVSEWRCFIRYGEILDIRFYAGNKGDKCDISVIEDAVKSFKNAPAAYSLDFGKTADGRTLLVEMNDGFAIGCYGLKDELYAVFLAARWAELTGVEDLWANSTAEKITEIAERFSDG